MGEYLASGVVEGPTQAPEDFTADGHWAAGAMGRQEWRRRLTPILQSREHPRLCAEELLGNFPSLFPSLAENLADSAMPAMRNPPIVNVLREHSRHST